MRIGSLRIQFHRTVRVAEGKAASNLPPSLGIMNFERVRDYKGNCPSGWEGDGYFAALHETEAMWMSFDSSSPVAILVGAGGINALTGEKLGTKLEKDNYLVAPPQPWLDGWKAKDGTVYQFVATAHKGGAGNTVAEQLIGDQSKTGAIGLAVFQPRKGVTLAPVETPRTLKYMSFDDPVEYPVASPDMSTVMGWGGSLVGTSLGMGATSMSAFNCAMTPTSLVPENTILRHSVAPVGKSHVKRAALASSSPKSPISTATLAEMGIGKGGAIVQKIYPDPHGLNAWREKPDAVMAIYLVNAEMFAAITGKDIPKPVVHDAYAGPWYSVNDKPMGDVAGSDKFVGLKSATAAFPGDTTNVPDDEWEEVHAGVV